MDELDLLKKDWNKQSDTNTFSAKEIYPMLLKRSSSIVKTLFYISIAELVFWIFLNFLVPVFYSEDFKQKMDSVLNDTFFNILSFLSYAVIAIFIYLLYKAYKTISVTDSIKNLMKNIINTRKIIKFYVAYNLVMVGASAIFGFYYGATHDPKLTEKFAHISTKETVILSLVVVIVTILFLLIIWLFYRLLYGLLLKRLNNNYQELKKLEV